MPRLDICALSGYNYNNYIFRRMRKVSEVIMEQKKIDRINELARKSKAEGLTEAEKAEQTELRNEYRASVTGNLMQQLEHTYIMTPDGKKHKVGGGKK